MANAALATEIQNVTRWQEPDSLSGRSVTGITFELIAHAAGSAFGIQPGRTDITHIGGRYKGKPGYDYNADWFEHPLKSLPKIIKGIFGG